MSLAEPLSHWPVEEIKFCHSYRTYNQAQEAAKRQAKQDETVSSEPVDQDRGRGNRHKFRSKRFLETSSDSGSDDRPVKKRKNSNKKKSGHTDKKKAPSPKLNVSPSVTNIQALLKSNRRSTGPRTQVKPGVSRFTGCKVAPQTSNTKESNVQKETHASTSKKKTLEEYETPLAVEKETIFQSAGFAISNNGQEEEIEINDFDPNNIYEVQSETPENMPHSSPDHTSPPTSPPLVTIRQSSTSPLDSTIPQVLDHSSSGAGSSKPAEASISGNKNLNSSLNFKSPFPEKPLSDKVTIIHCKKKLLTSSSSKIAELKTSSSRETLVVAELMEEINSKLDIQGMNIAKILQCVDPEEAVIERPPGLPSLPLADEAAFNKFEEFLAVPTNSTATSLYLSGKLMDQTVPYKGAQKLLRSLISNSLARLIPWEGTQGLKIAFNKTKCSDVLLSAILRRFSEKHMGLVKQKIQKWFTTSQGRKVSSAGPHSSNDDRDD